MAQGSEAPCPCCDAIRYWSTPRLTYCAQQMGKDDVQDNARSLDGTRGVVSNFRCGSPQLDNVWMKDTWDDTGMEPDPAQAAAPMWMSPYIWVRNDQDTKLENQHDHQNPKFGQTNWAYVKLHNGGATTSGNLELYYADASTSLEWPLAWKLISSAPVSTFDANSTKVVEFQWDNLPGLGHYCLLARWNSAGDPMTKVEGPDVEPNVRGNNNIVWRNLHIVGLTNQASSGVDLIVGGADARSRVEIRAPANLEGNSFLDFGTLTVELDKPLARAIRRTGSTRSGLKAVGRTSFVVGRKGATLSEFRLDAKARARLHLTFRQAANKPYTRRVFRVDVVQTRLEHGKRILVGAVSYEVRINKP